MRKIQTAIMMLGLVSGTLLVSTVFGAVTELPFSANFEANNLGDELVAPWVSDGIPTVITNTPASPATGSTNVAYSADEVSLAIDGDHFYYSNVWWHSYAKVRVHTNNLEASEIDGAAAGFYLRDTGELKAYSNNNWVTVAENLSTNGWLGFSVELDYANSNWNLYVSPSAFAHGDTFELANKSGPLGFNADYGGTSGLTNVQVTGETYLDNMALAKSYQTISEEPSSNTNVVVGETVDLKIDTSNWSGVLLSYFPVEDRTLTGALGEALASMMNTTESISVYIPTNSTWLTYTYNGTVTGWTTDGAIEPEDLTFTPTMGIVFNLADSTPRTATFLAGYGTPDNSIGSSPIYGRGSEGSSGWNLKALPGSLGDRTISNGVLGVAFFGFAPKDFDRMFFKGSNGEFIGLRFVTAYGGWVRYGRTPVTVTIPAGSGFWYLRNTGDTVDYEPK